MKKHLLCLTVDTDPDGLSGRVTNRQTLQWNGLEHLHSLPDELAEFSTLDPLPITWFVRADGQLESILGSAAYLLETYDNFWAKVKRAGHELGWHPHLYRQAKTGDAARLIADPMEASDELERLWKVLNPIFHATAFRNGEGWHTAETYTAVERLGFSTDSTAIPGRRSGSGHPMNWTGAPNEPYYPSFRDLCKSGPQRAMVELPMNTWRLQAPADDTPKIRYMNPAVHPKLFANALQNWENAGNVSPADLCIWVMIFHPDEVLATQADDALYSRSTEALGDNLVAIAESLRRAEHEFEWMTISDAAKCWKENRERLGA